MARQIAAGNAEWRLQFRFRRLCHQPCLPELTSGRHYTMSNIAPDGWGRVIRLFIYSVTAALLYWAFIFFFIAPFFARSFEWLFLCALVLLWGACALFAARATPICHLFALAAGLAWGSALWWCIIISLQNWRLTIVYPWVSVFSPAILAVAALPFWWLARRRRTA